MYFSITCYIKLLATITDIPPHAFSLQTIWQRSWVCGQAWWLASGNFCHAFFVNVCVCVCWGEMHRAVIENPSWPTLQKLIHIVKCRRGWKGRREGGKNLSGMEKRVVVSRWIRESNGLVKVFSSVRTWDTHTHTSWNCQQLCVVVRSRWRAVRSKPPKKRFLCWQQLLSDLISNQVKMSQSKSIRLTKQL